MIAVCLFLTAGKASKLSWYTLREPEGGGGVVLLLQRYIHCHKTKNTQNKNKKLQKNPTIYNTYKIQIPTLQISLISRNIFKIMLKLNKTLNHQRRVRNLTIRLMCYCQLGLVFKQNAIDILQKTIHSFFFKIEKIDWKEWFLCIPHIKS